MLPLLRTLIIRRIRLVARPGEPAGDMARQALDFLHIRADKRVFGNLPLAGVRSQTANPRGIEIEGCTV